jgi:hypothetical protein
MRKLVESYQLAMVSATNLPACPFGFPAAGLMRKNYAAGRQATTHILSLYGHFLASPVTGFFCRRHERAHWMENEAPVLPEPRVSN